MRGHRVRVDCLEPQSESVVGAVARRQPHELVAAGRRWDVGSVAGDHSLQRISCCAEDWGWLMRSKQIKGVTVLWPLKLPDHVAATGDYGGLVPAAAARLRAALKPAT